jgi:hypothetical protein
MLLTAGTVTVSGFDQVPGNIFYDLLSDNGIGSETLGGVFVNPSPTVFNGSFELFYTLEGAPAVPGDRSGVFDTYAGVGGLRPLTLNFSQPVAAFGGTFVHMLERDGLDTPVVISAFSGSFGTGQLLGTVTDSLGEATADQASADFVGVWSDAANINSVVIDSVSNTGGWALDGYAISLTPVPEPSAASLISAGVVVLLFARRMKR